MMHQQWPILSYEKGKETFDTLHMWTQIVGKIKLAILPWINHSWHVTLQPSSQGFSTGLMPYEDYNFQIDFDFTDHHLKVATTKGEQRKFSLQSISVSDFYFKIFQVLEELNIHIKIKPVPVEIQDPIPFEKDNVHHTYDTEQITAFHAGILKIRDVFLIFRSEFKGKCSPIHFFWGGFDLALSFFSGRRAPKHPGGVPGLPDWVAEEAYNREVSSCGFWTGNEAYPHAAFYCYLYPEPNGYKAAKILPAEAFYHKDLGEFILPYIAVQQSEDSGFKLMEFLTSTYRAGANLAQWERELLED
jgi:hypothetical protein